MRSAETLLGNIHELFRSWCWLRVDASQQSLCTLQLVPDFVVKPVRIEMHHVISNLSNSVKDSYEFGAID